MFDIKITFFDSNLEKGAFKGMFDCLVDLGECKLEIKGIRYFQKGEKSWISLPGKWKNENNSWRMEYPYVQFQEPKGVFERKCTDAVKAYLGKEVEKAAENIQPSFEF